LYACDAAAINQPPMVVQMTKANSGLPAGVMYILVMVVKMSSEMTPGLVRLT